MLILSILRTIFGQFQTLFSILDLDSEKYNAKLTVKHKTDYYYQNLILFFQQTIKLTHLICTLAIGLVKELEIPGFIQKLKNLNFDKKTVYV